VEQEKQEKIEQKSKKLSQGTMLFVNFMIVVICILGYSKFYVLPAFEEIQKEQAGVAYVNTMKIGAYLSEHGVKNEAEMNQYVDQVLGIVDRVGEHEVVFRKASIMSGGKDITEFVISKLNIESEQEKTDE